MIVIGDHIIDKYIIGTATRLSPEAPVPVINKVTENVRDGGAGNVVANLKAFGHVPLYIRNPRQNTVKTRIIADNHLICRLDSEQYIPYSFDLSMYLKPQDTKFAVISDYNKGVVHEPKEIIKQLHADGIDAMVDPKKPFAEYAGAFLIKPNKAEFEKEVGQSYDQRYVADQCRNLCKKYDFCYIIITLGAGGCYVYDHLLSKGNRIQGEKRTVIDVTGAGDVFMAALAHYALDNTILEAARFANNLAGLSVSHMGTYILKKEDISSFEKEKRPTIVFTNGCFDVLHRGHFELLEKSKALGDKLIIGLNSDASVRRLKGDDRPFFSQENRKTALEAITYVDEVIIFDEDTPIELIKKIKPDIITKGGDYTVENVVGNDLARVVIIPSVEGQSTTKTLQKMKR